MQLRGTMHAPPPLKETATSKVTPGRKQCKLHHKEKCEMSTATEVAGEAKKKSTAMVEVVTPLVQGFDPVNKIHQHLCAFHLYSDDMGRLPVEAQHYCAHQNEEVQQCLVYDSSGADARLIGVEYIVSEVLFLTLPDIEKPLWHSHEYEVKSGVLFLPGMLSPLQLPDLGKVCKTYGKVFHFWQVDRGDPLPLGLPLIMMALTKDNQLPRTLVHDVEKKYGVSLAKEREARAYMSGPNYGIHPLANGNGMGLRLEINERELDVPTKL